MKRGLIGLAIALAASCVLLVGTSGYSQPEGEKLERPEPMAKAADDLDAEAPPEALPVDEAFQKFVDLALLPQAVDARDAGLAADVALQLAEGERTLGRPHKAITSAQAMNVAVRLAVESRDKETLDRLARAAKGQKNAELAEQVESARQLAAAPRSKAKEAPTFTPEQIEEGAFEAYREWEREVEAARLAGDREKLEALRADAFETMGLDLGEQARAYLLRQTEDALKNLPEKGAAEADMLSKLLAGSRGMDDENERANVPQQVSGAFLTGSGLPSNIRGSIWTRVGPSLARYCYISRYRVNTSGLPELNRKVFLYARANMGRRVGSGQCAALNYAAVRYATGRHFNNRGRPRADDYDWGRLIGTITPRNYGTVRNILPGDLLQFRNVRFAGSYTYRRGTRTYRGTWSSTANHHSAVVLGRGSNFVNTFDQNSGGRLYVTQGLCYFPAMQSGTIWVYRPSRN